MIDRRDFLKSAATLAFCPAMFIKPAKRPNVDLVSFCSRYEQGRYDLRLPYTVGPFTYATDARVCVRVRPELGDVVQHKGKVPPFEGLSWNHDRIRGWSGLPSLEPLMADDSDCPVCDGLGHTGATEPVKDCERCDGMGRDWVGSDWSPSYPRPCPVCKGKGYALPPGAVVCAVCQGNAIGRFPRLVELGGVYYDAKLYGKVRGLGAEYVQDNWNADPSRPMMKFRFDGGTGMLMAVEPAVAAKRLGGTA